MSNTYILPYPHIRNFTFYKSEEVDVYGIVSNFPRVDSNFSSFILSAQELIWAEKIYPVCGKVLVRIFRKENIFYGDQLILTGRLYRPYQAKNGRFSYRDYLERQHIYSILTVSKNKPIKYLGKGKANSLKLLAFKIRKQSIDILFKYLKPRQAGILSAMILGERSKVSPQLRRIFIQTGTIHILAISGLHVGIVAFMLELLLKSLRMRRRKRYLIIIILLIFYCFLTGSRPSVIRSTIMAIILLAGLLLRKESQINNSIALAALIILIYNPRQMFDLGFQLSFVSVISIVYLSPIIKDFLEFKFNLSNNRVIRLVILALSVSLAAWLGVLPLVAYYFKVVSVVAVLANLVIVPYLALVVILGFILLLIGFSMPLLAPIFAASSNLSLIILIYIVNLFNKIPFAYFYLS